jgi:hypothetical protein
VRVGGEVGRWVAAVVVVVVDWCWCATRRKRRKRRRRQKKRKRWNCRYWQHLPVPAAVAAVVVVAP